MYGEIFANIVCAAAQYVLHRLVSDLQGKYYPLFLNPVCLI